MIKYVEHSVVFREVPNEITLAINISNCPIRCKDCHSKYLWDDIGINITYPFLKSLIEENSGITAISLMGGDSDPKYMCALFAQLSVDYPDLKRCWYSGREYSDEYFEEVLPYLNYLKVGPYIEEKGGLDSIYTNQKFYELDHKIPDDIRFVDKTHLFRKKYETENKD